MSGHTLQDWAITGGVIGFGLLLSWTLYTTNATDKALGEIEKDITSNTKEHDAEVARSSKVDADQSLALREAARERKELLLKLYANEIELTKNSTALKYLHKRGMVHEQ